MAEFRLLGLVEVWSGARRVPTGQPRQRLVMAALLVDAGRPVTPEALVWRVWGDTPPDSARHAIHEYLTRIRRLIGELSRSGSDGGIRLTRRGGVYVLDVDPDLVDLHRFRRLVEQARDPSCPDAERVEVLGEALGLWRGEALADLSGEWVAQVRETGRRQRLEAAVLWAQAQLRLGRAGDVVEPLAALAADNPLSEPLVAVLMRALHVAGRSVEALDHYTILRKRLVEDLGTEPGPDLQAVHQAVLRGEPTGTDRPAVGSTETQPHRVATAQLPPGVGGFAGRDEELARLDAIVHDRERRAGTVAICTIFGAAGVGKTALAVHWAHRVADQFPDGQLYVNLRGFDPSGSVMTAADAVRGFLDGLAVPPARIPADLTEQTALYRSLLAGRRMLVLLDNARDAEQVRPLLPGSAGCVVVVTSRQSLTSLIAVEGAVPLLLDVLTEEGSHRLLAQRLGAGRIAAEPEATAEIIARCARLPLALAVIAARAAVRPAMPLAALAEQLSEAHGHLDTLSAGDAISDVRAALFWSYRALDPAAADLFRLLGLHPGPDISAAAAAGLAGVPHAEVVPRLGRLTAAHMLTEHQPGRYVFHDLLRAYATELAHRDPDQSRRAAVHRVLDHYLHTAHAADRLLNPARDPITLGPPRPDVTPEVIADAEHALAWFAAEHRVLLAAVDHAAASGFDTHTWQLAYVLTTHLYRRGHRDANAAIQRTAVAAAARLGEPDVLARTHRNLANAYIVLGRFAEAQEQLRHALAVATETGDLASQAHTHHGLAYIGQAQGRHADALDHARQALRLFQTTGQRLWQANALNNVGWLAARLGEYQEAIASCEAALALHEEGDDQYGQAAAWDSLGYAHHQLGAYYRAVDCYNRAADLVGRVGDRYQEADILNRLGDLHATAHDRDAALRSYERALAILDDLGHSDATQVRDKIRELP